MMKPGMKFDANLTCRAPTEGADPAHLRIECISFGKAGLPRRRRLVSLLSMLRPPRPARVSERRAALLAAFDK